MVLSTLWSTPAKIRWETPDSYHDFKLYGLYIDHNYTFTLLSFNVIIFTGEVSATKALLVYIMKNENIHSDLNLDKESLTYFYKKEGLWPGNIRSTMQNK